MSIRIVSKKIDVSQEAESCEPEARNVITAMIRSTKFSDASDVSSVVFETYEDLAAELMEKIQKDVTERFRVSDVKVVQRVGKIPVGECALLVTVAARRVEDALSACKFIVDEMNAELPVWKFEVKDGQDL
ncbi:MAG: molybdenum cofactor biosynthesis protein MoaE [Candidatus Thermoplasmatota archaeon]|jgi:molybdopterin synthase catalytic subunit|nr:molybdenum cofactor biosynthesis protein MoaE [Candidatus Thermoplasmatota archaeon]MCL5954679.1 molybdenum cofactor biosynthesis protein MoaE [Candidatus Thermoplasmatota archaeon]